MSALRVNPIAGPLSQIASKRSKKSNIFKFLFLSNLKQIFLNLEQGLGMNLALFRINPTRFLKFNESCSNTATPSLQPTDLA